jgi:SAM-dependent methyltransferase
VDPIHGPNEPLDESAPLAWSWAQCLCDPLGDCVWYHGLWQILRLVGIGKTAGGHAEFLIGALREAAREGTFPRVLVSGTADYSMPAQVIWAYDREAAPVELTVLDRCVTPLALSRWYAGRAGATIDTIKHEVVDANTENRFDLIVTNSFLGHFTPGERPKLVRAWGRLLRPGGKLVLTNRIRPSADSAMIGFDDSERARLCGLLRERIGLHPSLATIEPALIERCALLYTQRFRVHPVRSCEEIVETLAAEGFVTMTVDTAFSAARALTLQGPTTTERANYARIVAVRR